MANQYGANVRLTAADVILNDIGQYQNLNIAIENSELF